MFNRSEELALRAALCPADEAIAAWENLRSTSSIENFDPAITRILPAIFRNIKNSLSTDDLVKLKGVVHYAWAKNTKFLQELRKIAAEFDEDATNYRVLKGGAINLLNESPNFRIMGDLDLLVSQKDHHKVLLALARAGFKPKFSFACPHDTQSAVRLELNFINDDSMEIDLHIAEEREEFPLFKQMLDTPHQSVVFSSENLKIPPNDLLAIHSIVHGHLRVGSSDQIQMMIDVDFFLETISIERIQELTRGSPYGASINQYLELRMKFKGDAREMENFGRSLHVSLKSSVSKKLRRTYFVASRLAKALRYRTPRISDLLSIWSQKNHNRIFYILWLYTGMIRQLESFLLGLSSGFIQKKRFPPSTVFPSSPWSNDWRFWISHVTHDERATIELTSEAFRNQHFLVFSNGKHVAVTHKSNQGRYLLILSNPAAEQEISLRLPFSGCRECAQALVDLKITKL